MSDLYREEAIKNIRSAKKLDSDVRVVSVRMWITLIISLAFVVALIIWGIVGKVPITTDVMGVYICSLGNLDIRAERSGTIETVPEGSVVYMKGDELCKFQDGEVIYSPSNISVRKFFVNPGEWVQEGDILFSCTRESKSALGGVERAYLYIPYDENDKFDYRLPVRLDAVGVAEDSSRMQGLIVYKTETVVSEEQIKKKFGMEEASEIFADGKPKIEVLCIPKEPGKLPEEADEVMGDVDVRQIKNQGWTFALSKDMEDDPTNLFFVPDMNLVKATVTLEYKRPITLLIPALESVFKPISAQYSFDEIDWERDMEPVE